MTGRGDNGKVGGHQPIILGFVNDNFALVILCCPTEIIVAVRKPKLYKTFSRIYLNLAFHISRPIHCSIFISTGYLWSYYQKC